MNKLFEYFLSLLLYSCSCVVFASQFCSMPDLLSLKNPKMVINNIPGREQWNNTNGYCGEVSLISAGLYYGQYLSQYDARLLANSNSPAPNKQRIQILLGLKGSNGTTNNIINALKQMHLNYEQFDNTTNRYVSTAQFLLWIKKHIIAHHPVMIGIYENTLFFDNYPDPEYDHIVPVFGIKSMHALNPLQYYEDDIIYFHDNDLYTEPNVNCFQYSFKSIQKSRENADKSNAGIYSLSNNVRGDRNYGVAISGVRAKGVNVLPVHLTTNPVNELPEIANNSDIRPRPTLIQLTISVSQLKPRTYYILYKYTNFSKLPKDDNFALSVGTPQKQCSIWLDSGSSFKTQENIQSNTMAIYRVIAAKNNTSIPPACTGL